MTDLTKKDVEKIAKLSRIEYSTEAIDKIIPELNSIMGMVEQLKEVDTENVEPMAGVGGYTLRYRETDETGGDDIQEKILANAPSSKFGCFAVPKVVGNN